MAASIPESEVANWAVANARQTRTRWLSPALNRAYSREFHGRPNPDHLLDARDAAFSIYRTLDEACNLMGLTNEAVTTSANERVNPSNDLDPSSERDHDRLTENESANDG